MSLSPITFPARRRGPAMLRFIATRDFLLGCSLGAGAILLVAVGIFMLFWSKL